MVVVEKLSMCAHFVTLKHPCTTAFVVKLHNILLSIVSNRYKIFTDQLWKELFKSTDNELHLSKKYHPQTNELTEKINQCLEMYLQYMVHKTLPSSGGNGLPWLKSIQNNIWV
jgi:hypothetical protein